MIYRSVLRPLLFRFEPEAAHELALQTLSLTLSTRWARDVAANHFKSATDFGELRRFGLTFKNPIGLAAGFDKNGRAAREFAALGFGFVEVGTLTFEPQTGNKKPRLFRLPKDKALINRLGFNNEGAAKIVERLKKLNPNCVLGVNIGKNKSVENEDAIENYKASFDLASEVADYIAVNVSSPNTPNLRELQKADALEKLLTALQTNTGVQTSCPLLVKIAPDLAEAEIEAIVDICLRLKIDGIIATNTTVSRENLQTKIDEIGGLSGKPLENRSNQVIRQIYRHSKGKLSIVGVGGIFTAEDAFEKIAAGACLLQAYTGFIYQGITFARDVNVGLAEILQAKG
ncbi:MAG: quinone-dependent dihydroorotate dehydrogenase, partial [Pyrinomonadaceae bacterium]